MRIDVLALITTVIIFIISITVNSVNTFIERRKKWYLEVVLSQNLSEVDTFYKNILSKFKENKKEINNQKNIGLTSLELVILTAKKTEELHDIKNRFSFQLMPIFKSYDKNFSKKLQNNLLSFQDIYTKALDVNNTFDDDDLVRELEESKIDFYQLLYFPVNESLFINTLLNRTLFRFFVFFYFIFGFLVSIFISINIKSIVKFYNQLI